ncbi:MAG TPA: hypothetical protein VKV74_11045 [Bryobacteraceae bacterium]|nr:hypothetical protein [Bryobacteraceae bacterium]
MKVDFVPFSEELAPACRAFNERLRQGGRPPFLLPEIYKPPRAGRGAIQYTHYVGVDELGAVRGGVLLMEQAGWLKGQSISLMNVQSPLSEGIVDRAFSGVGLKLLQFLARRNPYAYAVGMGSEGNPFARLLRGAGWKVARVPFQFAVIKAERFLREIGPLRGGAKGMIARLLASSGLGAMAFAAWRRRRRYAPPPGYSLEEIASWPAEVSSVWNCCRDDFHFALTRDACALEDLHPAWQTRLRRYALRGGDELLGWSAGLMTQMRDSPYFGNLGVATILDALAPPAHLEALLAYTYGALRDLGADVIVANFTHDRWRERLGKLGFFGGPSNYLLAISKPLASALEGGPGGLGRAYVSRADGDGRLNL